MAQRQSRRTATDSPQSAAGFVRRSAQTIRKSAAGLNQYRAECLALVKWAEEERLLLPFDYIERYKYIGEGAEHRVYRDDSKEDLAIKATRPNRFGYSTVDEGK